MKHGKNTLRLTALLTAALMLLLTLCGCSRGMIKEDSVHEDLPDIDPEAGIAKDMRAKLYYRLTDEAYLVGVTATITVYAGEREERAMIRTLMEGTPPLSGNISAVIPAGTEIVDVSLEGAILYVTLSAEFFNTNIVDEAVADGSRLMENGLLSKSILRLSILDISKISLIIPNKYLDDTVILSKQARTRPVSDKSSFITSVMPIMEFIGVRIS